MREEPTLHVDFCKTRASREALRAVFFFFFFFFFFKKKKKNMFYFFFGDMTCGFPERFKSGPRPKRGRERYSESTGARLS